MKLDMLGLEYAFLGSTTFFLSDKNDKEKPLKKVADLMVVNDC